MSAHRSRNLKRDAGAILESTAAANKARASLLRAMPSSLQSLAALGYSPEEINTYVVPRRTLARRNALNEPLSMEETDKATRLQRVASRAHEVFGNAEKANRWLRKPKDRLDGETPLTFLGSEAGARVVEEMLVQIEEGMFV